MGETITVIMLLGLIIWNLVDFFKVYWKDVPQSRFITLGVSAILSFASTFTFGLDIINAIIPTLPKSTLGIIVTGLALMGESSLLSKIINGTEKIKNGEFPKKEEETEEK